MVRRPSRDSKVRVFRGWERRAVTRVRRVEDWTGGVERGSRRSRRSCWGRLAGVRLFGLGGECGILVQGEGGGRVWERWLCGEGGETYVHVDFAGEEGAGGRVDEEDSLQEVQG